MNSDNPEKDELDQAISESLSQDVSPELEERMQGSLREFKKKLPDHPYVRSLEKKRRREGGGINLRLSRWKVILACLAIAYVLILNRTEAVRQDRLTAVIEGRAQTRYAPSLVAGTNVRELNCEIDRLLAQGGTEDLKGTDMP